MERYIWKKMSAGDYAGSTSSQITDLLLEQAKRAVQPEEKQHLMAQAQYAQAAHTITGDQCAKVLSALYPVPRETVDDSRPYSEDYDERVD